MIINKGMGVNEVNILKQIQKLYSPKENCGSELCNKQTCGAGKNVLGFNHKGDILPCGRFTWNDTSYYLGNVFEKMNEGLFFDSISSFQNRNKENWANCNVCQAKSICNYGCQAFIVRSVRKVNVECLSTKMFYSYFMNIEPALKVIYQNNKYPITSEYDDYSYSDYSDYNDNY